LLVVAAALAGLRASSAAHSQTRRRCNFVPANTGRCSSGTIIGSDSFDYKLGAKAGQKLFVELTVAGTNGDGTIYLIVLQRRSGDLRWIERHRHFHDRQPTE
jgi:hypothetical protein